MKKAIIAMLIISAAFGWQACNRTETRYVDLNTGETIELKDSSGIMINAVTGERIGLYVDTRSGDTIYGRTGKVVNGSVRRSSDERTWVYVDGEDQNDEDEGTKIKVEGGETKIKDGDYKKEV